MGPIHDVLIIGAGPAGAALAWQLGNSGLDVLLLDRQGPDRQGNDHSTPQRPPFRGEALMPSGLAALEAMGLGDLLEAVPTRPLADWRFQVEGQTLFSAGEPWGDPRPCTLVPQDALLGALLDRCSLLPTLTVELGRCVHGLRHDADHRVRGVSLSDGSVRLARLVVAADGRDSLLRRLAELTLDPGPGPEMIVDWFQIPRVPEATENEAGEAPSERSFWSVIAGGELFSTFTAARGEAQHLALVREPQDPPLPTGATLAARLAAIAPDPALRWLGAQGAALQQPISLQVRVGQARSWSRPGLLLLGDAAHPMSPVRAQGLNMALRDAVVAARTLIPVLSPEPPTTNVDRGEGDAQPPPSDPLTERRRLDQALVTIEARRRPEITTMQRLQAQESRKGLLLRRQPLLRALLAAAAPWLGTRLRQHWMHSQLPLRLGLGDLSDDGATPGAPMARPTTASSALTVTLLLAAGLQSAGLAQPVQEPPSTPSLRAIQLAAQICGRDNTETSCARARALADPLMDHSAVSSSCKDSVFGLVQRARVSDRNSEDRRSRLDKLGEDVLRFCRARPKPVTNSENGQPQSGGSSPFGLRGGPQNNF